MLHLLDDPVGAAAEHADGLEVVGLDRELLAVDRDVGAAVEGAQRGAWRGAGPELTGNHSIHTLTRVKILGVSA